MQACLQHRRLALTSGLIILHGVHHKNARMYHIPIVAVALDELLFLKARVHRLHQYSKAISQIFTDQINAKRLLNEARGFARQTRLTSDIVRGLETLTQHVPVEPRSQALMQTVASLEGLAIEETYDERVTKTVQHKLELLHSFEFQYSRPALDELIQLLQ